MKNLKCPPGLKTAGKAFWRKANSEFTFETAADFERLRSAATCIDQIRLGEKVLEEEGLFVTDRWDQKKEHPASKMIRENKTLFCRIIRELGLDLQSEQESRIPGRY